ncbi:TPA: ead/Ea22-like family protein [Salmonella enterica]
MTIDKRALREVAEKATPGNWRRTSSLFNGITVTPFSLCGEEVTLAHTVEKRDAEFIAAANPRTMLALLDENIQLQREKDAMEAVALALLDELKTAKSRITELEKIATDYALKFQKAQDALKYADLLRKSELEVVENNLIDSECHVAELEEALRDKQALLEASEKRNAKLQSENAYIRNRYKELDLLIGKNILVMQAAIIEWQATGDAKSGLAWIYNTLFGPGELPDESEKDAQAYFNRKYAPIDEKLMALHKWFWEQSEAERAAGIRIKGE